MHKKSFQNWTIVFLSILLIPVAGTEQAITDIQPTESSLPPFIEENNSFGGESKGENTNWYIVKLHSNRTIHINEIYVNMEANDTGAKWALLSRFVIINFETGEFWTPPVGIVLGGSRLLEWYLQVDIGRLNFTWNHLCEEGKGRAGGGYHVYNLSLSSGTWYVVALIAPTIECHITMHINGTNAEIGGPSQGSTAFSLENEDFRGTLNLKTILLSLIFDGEKAFHVDNTFIGFVYFPIGIGTAYAKYVSPEGKIGECQMWSTFRETYISNESDFYPVFTPIMGGEGDWTFYASMAVAGLGTTIINVLGADVVLPE